MWFCTQIYIQLFHLPCEYLVVFSRTSKVPCHLDKLGNLRWSRKWPKTAPCGFHKPVSPRPQFVNPKVKALNWVISEVFLSTNIL